MAEHRIEVRRVLVVGAGAIGTSWARFLLARGLETLVVDPDEQALDALRARLGPEADGRLQTFVDLVGAGTSADLVIEAGPEDLSLKQQIFRALDTTFGADVLLTSSTSALTATDLQDACDRHPERVLVAHPFNPPHVMPLVELVGGQRTSEKAIDAASDVLHGWGKRPVRLGAEIPGHVANRLQAALWREAYHLVDVGAASAADIDEVIAWGPGLRWGILGPFATQHLSGGAGGFAHLMEHLGPPTEGLWKLLGQPQLTPATVDRLVASVDEEFAGVDVPRLEQRRDAALHQLIRVKTDLGFGDAPVEEPERGHHDA